MLLKISSEKWRPCCSGLSVLKCPFSMRCDWSYNHNPESRNKHATCFDIGSSTARLLVHNQSANSPGDLCHHDDVVKWKHIPRNWPFVRGIHRSPMNSPHRGQWRGALMFPLICVWINGWENNRDAGDLLLCLLWRHCNYRRAIRDCLIQ